MSLFFKTIPNFVLIFIFCQQGVSQNKMIDSLRTEVSQMSQLDSAKVELMKDFADEFYGVDFDSTIHYYQICLDLSQKLPHYKVGLSTLRSFGYVYSFQKNNYEKALEYFGLAKELASTEKDSSGLALAYSDMGRIFWKKGQSAKAMEYHLNVRKIGEELGSDRILLRSNLSLGIIHNEEGDNEKALDFYNDALVQADSLGNSVAKGLVLNNMGNAYRDENKLELSLEYFQKSEEVFLTIKRYGRLAMVNSNIGKNYQLTENYNKSLTFFKKALDYNSKVDDGEQRTSIYSAIAEVMLKIGNYPQAIENANKGIALLENVETDLYYDDLYKIIAESWKKLGNYKKSLVAYELHLAAKDSLNRNETSEKIEELNALYKQQKNETEIQRLNFEKEKNAHQLDKSQSFVKLLLALLGLVIIGGFLFFTYNRMRQLKESDGLKTKLSKDLHDNIGASLNHIKMLSTRLIRINRQPEKENIVEQSKENVEQIKKISDELMFDLYDMLWSLDKVKSTLGDLVERMEDHIDTTIRVEGYKVQNDFEKLNREIILPVEVKTNVYFIFKESIHNIFKHTCPCSVYVSMWSEKKRHLSLEIKNEFKEKISDPLFSSKKGLKNMKKRAAELKGDLVVEETPNSFTVRLELKNY